MNRPILILILTGTCLTAAANTDSNLVPHTGPHGVGVRIVQQYDYSRVMDPQFNVFGKSFSTGPARPIQTLVWYPAKRSERTPMRAADYRHASMSDVDFNYPESEANKQLTRWITGPHKAKYAASTLAVRGAEPAGGIYPVLIFAPGLGSPAHENLDLCEYLTSHGYLVIASRSLGARSGAMTADVEGVEAQASDIAFLTHYAHSLPQADMNKVAVIGSSWGGIANVFAAARSSRIQALVSLDGSIRYFPEIWGAATDVKPVRTNVPMLFSAARAPGAEEMERNGTLVPSYLNKMKYSDVYVTQMAPMTHLDFSSWHLRFAGDDAFGDYQRAEVLHAYRSNLLYVHRFLDAYLKQDADALAFLRQPPSRHGIVPQVMSMRFYPAFR